MPFAMTNQSGTLMATGPTDICKTPGVGPFPYPNVSMMTSADTNKLSTKVKIAGAKAATIKTSTKISSGNEAGVGGGAISGKNVAPVGFSKGSLKVKIQGNPAVRLGDPTKHNGLPNFNTPGAAIAPSQVKVNVGG